MCELVFLDETITEAQRSAITLRAVLANEVVCIEDCLFVGLGADYELRPPCAPVVTHDVVLFNLGCFENYTHDKN